MRVNLSTIPNVTVYKRDEMPERFHYSKPKHRLGDITVMTNTEGHILSPVSISIDIINHYFRFICRQQLMHPMTIKVIMDGIIHGHQCKLYLWLVVLYLIVVLKFIH